MIAPARVAAKTSDDSEDWSHDHILRSSIRVKQTGMTSFPCTNDRLPLNEGDALSSA